MIKDYAKFDVGRLTIEVNWSKEVTPCKQIKVTMDGKEELVEHADFYTMMMLFADDKTQEDMIETKSTEMRVVQRMLTIRAKTDMKAGESIVVPYKYSIPESEYQRMKKDGQQITLVEEK